MSTSINPFASRLEKAKARLHRLEQQAEHLRRNALPGSYVTGRSGQSAAYRRKLDRQLDRTIDLSVAIEQARRDVWWLQASADAFAAGTINAQGRAITPVEKRSRQRSRREGKRLMVAVCATGLMYCDTWREIGGDYAELAFLSYRTLELQQRSGWKGAPAALRAEVEAHAAGMQARRGEQFRVSAGDQYVILGQP